MYLRSHDNTTSIKKYTKCYIQSPLETRSVVQMFMTLENRLNNSTSRIISRITDPPDTNPTSPLPTLNVAAIDTPINHTIEHEDNLTYSYPIELPTPTELLFSSPRIQNEDTNIGTSEHSIDTIVSSPPTAYAPSPCFECF